MVEDFKPDQIGIYIHIPFCQSKCGYCDYYSLPCKTDHPIIDEFVNALAAEIKLQSASQTNTKLVNTIYFGGGTPSLLSADHIKKIYLALAEHFNLDNLMEFSIEVNPGTITRKKLTLLKETGINRISIGIQAFQDRLLDILNRTFSCEQGIQAVNLARQAGFDNINLDLMFGIPEQTVEDWQKSLKKAVELEPQHLSIYNLIYEKGTPFYNQRVAGTIRPMEENMEKLLYNLSVETIEKAGFNRYENSNYCKPGFECKHNLAYWNYIPYSGFGPSAHSFDGRIRSWNIQNLTRYISLLNNGKLAIQNKETITKKLRLEEWIFLQMFQTKGLCLKEIQTGFGDNQIDWPEQLNTTIGKQWQNLLLLDDNNLSFTNDGFWLSDEILPKLINLMQK